MNLKKTIKGQSLPLNTIVIAILVIIVLLVIVVFFASNVGDSQGDINTLKGCNLDNPAVSSLGYDSVVTQPTDPDNPQCPGGNYERIFVVPGKQVTDGDGNPTGYQICCGLKNNN